MSDAALEQVVELALKLSVAEQARLLERVAAHLAGEVNEQPVDLEEQVEWTDEELADLLKPSTPKSGAEIAAMIESGELNPGAWRQMANPEISDPVEWLRALRRDISEKRHLDWNNE